MKYDTTPLSIDTAGVDLTPPEQELRFVPEDEHPDSGPISQQTVISPALETQIGYATFIEPPQTNRLVAIKEKLEAPKYRTWALTALLASISAVAGGLAVFWVSSADRPQMVQSQPQLIAAEPVTDIQSSETFVAKQPTDSAAERPLVPQTPQIPNHRERILNPGHQVEETMPANAINDAVNGLQLDTPTAAVKTEQPTPEKEAKVGAYIVEKPGSRKPLARCSDGTYSFSASKSAACAGRGGVSEWMSGDKPSTVTTPAKQAAYILGPRGGCYYLDSSSKKIYVEKKYCQ
ncbi:MAG TPA: DUF3761 domain-containing protein [Pyrinomonadaceae bacterium]|nr:DUF3761 domain-containing protein [Pyrinomonadaceae bacterium]